MKRDLYLNDEKLKGYFGENFKKGFNEKYEFADGKEKANLKGNTYLVINKDKRYFTKVSNFELT